MTTVHIHAPKCETTIRTLKCSTCKKRRRMVVDMYEWYDPTATCGTCGETWTGGERCERPFEPGWRKKNIAYAQSAIVAFRVPR